MATFELINQYPKYRCRHRPSFSSFSLLKSDSIENTSATCSFSSFRRQRKTKNKRKKTRKKRTKPGATLHEKCFIYVHNKYHDNIDEQQTSSSHNVAFSQNAIRYFATDAACARNHIVFIVFHTCPTNMV